jgi:hypothetical protein
MNFHTGIFTVVKYPATRSSYLLILTVPVQISSVPITGDYMVTCVLRHFSGPVTYAYKMW